MVDENLPQDLSKRDFLKLAGLSAIRLAIPIKPSIENRPEQIADPFAKEFINPEELLGKGNEFIDVVKLGMGTPRQTIDSSFYAISNGSFGQEPIPEQNETFYLKGNPDENYFKGANISVQVTRQDSLKFQTQEIPVQSHPGWKEQVARVSYLVVALDNATRTEKGEPMVISKAKIKIDNQEIVFEGHDVLKWQSDKENGGHSLVFIPIQDNRLKNVEYPPKNLLLKPIVDVQRIDVNVEGTKGETVNFVISREKPGR